MTSKYMLTLLPSLINEKNRNKNTTNNYKVLI